MGLDIRLFGAIDAYVNGRVVELGHARQRCVLAALLVDANRAVPVDLLVDRVWPAQQVPQRARNAVYTYITRLRGVLAATGDDVELARRPGGYLLTVDPMAVDLHRFHRLLARSRSTDADPAALALVEEALALCRGPALAGVDTPWANEIRAAMEEQRLAAELDRNDLALRLGRHTGLLTGLAAAAAVRPLDERLAGQLMLALYRSGRQNEALAQYQQVRLRLAEELGADPSPPLRDLHRQILRADPDLTAPAPPVPQHVPVPRQLPTPVRHFTGRADEIRALDGLLAETAAPGGTVVISAIAGTAGIGKTALAVHWAHRVADRFPDGQLYLNLRGFDPAGQVMDPTEAVRRLLDALGVPPQKIPADLDAQSAQYRSHLAARRMLIVLDNVRDTAQARPLLPGTSSCLTLVTSRNRLTGLVADGAHPVALDLLSEAESRDVLRRRLGDERVAAEPAALAEIVRHCARLPLALAIVGARAATQPRLPLAVLAGELREARARLDALVGDDPHSDVRAVFSWSYRALSPAAARLFRLIGLHPGPDLSTAAAASLAALAPDAVRSVLAELSHANLVVEPVPGRYTCHDLLRAYAATQARAVDSDAERLAASHRMIDHYLHSAYAGDQLIKVGTDAIEPPPLAPGVAPERFEDRETALAWFTAEHQVLLAVLDRAATGFDTHAWQLAWTLWTFLDWRGHWHDQITAGRAAVAAAARLADPAARSRTGRALASAYLRMGRLDEADAELRHCLDWSRAAGDDLGQAHAHHNLAQVRERQGRLDEALAHARRSLVGFRAAGHRQGEAQALNAVGWYHILRGEHREALAHCEPALALYEELAQPEGQAATWDSLGYAHHHLGRYAQAVACYRRALDLYELVGNRYEGAATLTRLGDTRHAAGEPAAAREAWQDALAILTALDHPEAAEVRDRLTGTA